MNDEERTVDLLDLDDDAGTDTLPEATPLAAPRPKKPWLLLGLGVLIIALATYVIVQMVGGGEQSSMEVDLDSPAIIVPEKEVVVPIEPQPVPMPTPVEVMPDVQPQQPAPMPQPAPTPMPAPQPAVVAPQPAPMPQPTPVVEPTVQPAVPVRVIEDRKDVTFNPNKVAARPQKVEHTPKKQVAKAPAKKPVSKPVAPKGSWFVQFGSYSSHDAANGAGRKMRAGHSGLFAGKDFVVTDGVANGKNVYRLRVPFKTSGDANGFCSNAKSDGLDCYVTK